MRSDRTLVLTLQLLCLATAVSAESLSNTLFVAFDLETTGFRPKEERIVEIGAVRFRGTTVITATNWLVNPKRPMPPIAARVHGISDAMVADAPDIGVVLPAFMAFADGAPLVAHNATFDTEFIAAESVRCKTPPPTNRVIDSLVLARLCFPLSPSYRLEDLTRELGLGTTGHHRALADAAYVHALMGAMFPRLDADLTLDEVSRMAGTPWPGVSE